MLFRSLGVMVLRRSQPELARPYRTWGYPFTPLIFLAVTAFMMAYLLVERPVQSLAGLATLVAGLAIYFFSQRRNAEPSQGVTHGE